SFIILQYDSIYPSKSLYAQLHPLKHATGHHKQRSTEVNQNYNSMIHTAFFGFLTAISYFLFQLLCNTPMTMQEFTLSIVSPVLFSGIYLLIYICDKDPLYA